LVGLALERKHIVEEVVRLLGSLSGLAEDSHIRCWGKMPFLSMLAHVREVASFLREYFVVSTNSQMASLALDLVSN